MLCFCTGACALAGSSLLALIDDIATLLDDIAMMSKAAAKKTAGVLGDDLALNAEQVAGVRAERELPVVWAVAKGSFLNKLILVPAALLISVLIPWAIPVLLIIGGAFLCFEGVEKLFHKFLHDNGREQHHREKLQAISDPSVNMVAYEKQKIKGAVRTDLILSAEIIVIILGIVRDSGFMVQVTVLSTLAVAITVGVYGIVAGIVKLDDAGLYLSKSAVAGGAWGRFKKALGTALLSSAPYMMKTLSVVGTAAMFLVGGGILVHNMPFIHHLVEAVTAMLANASGLLSWLAGLLMEALVGIVLGMVVLFAVTMTQKLIRRYQSSRGGAVS